MPDLPCRFLQIPLNHYTSFPMEAAFARSVKSAVESGGKVCIQCARKAEVPA